MYFNDGRACHKYSSNTSKFPGPWGRGWERKAEGGKGDSWEEAPVLMLKALGASLPAGGLAAWVRIVGDQRERAEGSSGQTETGCLVSTWKLHIYLFPF